MTTLHHVNIIINEKQKTDLKTDNFKVNGANKIAHKQAVCATVAGKCASASSTTTSIGKCIYKRREVIEITVVDVTRT